MTYMTLDDLIPPHVTQAVADLGLHKIAGAMLGVPELTIKEALETLGARAYLRRKEARAIAEGIAAYAVVTNEKTALESPALMALLRRAAMPAAVGAGIAAAPRLLSNDPMQQQGSVMHDALLGALLGGTGGIAHGMHGLPAPLSQEVATALR